LVGDSFCDFAEEAAGYAALGGGVAGGGGILGMIGLVVVEEGASAGFVV